MSAADFLPHLTIRRAGTAPGMSNKVSVNFNGEALTSWITPSTRSDIYAGTPQGTSVSLPTTACCKTMKAAHGQNTQKVEAMFSDDSRDGPGIHLVLKTAHSMTRAFGNSSSSDNRLQPSAALVTSDIGGNAATGNNSTMDLKQQPPMEKLVGAVASDVDIESEL